ncbi:hypothetical protein BJV74DRAFT_800197 [Russula compacta]|nr:hypothetical protein BJV74DRAFT_800197 [Russula compacta]
MGIGVRVSRQLLVVVMIVMVVVVVVVAKHACTLVYMLQIGAEECLSVGVRVGGAGRLLVVVLEQYWGQGVHQHEGEGRAGQGREAASGGGAMCACTLIYALQFGAEIGVRARWAAGGGGGVIHTRTLTYALSSLRLMHGDGGKFGAEAWGWG